MKKRLTSLLLLVMTCGMVTFGAVNRILEDAKARLSSARTEQDFRAALELFDNATKDINYNEAEHAREINNGRAACNRALNKARRNQLTVNDNSRSVATTVDYGSTPITYTVKTDQGSVAVNGLPEWATVQSNGNGQIVIYVGENDTYLARQCVFTFNAGKAIVKASIRQKAKPQPTTPDPATELRKLTITDVTFQNTDYNNQVITAAGEPLYAHELRYLRPVITYNGANNDKYTMLYTRVYDPAGNLMSMPGKSPEGYTQGYDNTFFKGDNNELRGLGFGLQRESMFGPGMYRVEFIIDEQVVYEAYANIVEREDDETYLQVNGSSSANIELNSAGGSQVVFISTSDADWSIVDPSSFLTVTKADDSSVKVTYGPNNSLEAREGRFFIQGAGRQVRVNVTQPSNGPSVVMNGVTLEENATVNGANGLQIHADFDVNNANHHRLQIVAFFYLSNGDKLYDTDARFRTGDGQVAVNRDVIVNSDAYDSGDFTLFIPYDQLDITEPGEYNLEFELGVYDFAIGDFLAFAPRVKFVYKR